MKKQKYSQDIFMVIMGGLLNALLGIIKITTGVLGNSVGLIVDGIESFLDLASAIITCLGIRYAHKPPDQRHPYGHGKAESLSAIGTGIILLISGSGVTISSFYSLWAHHHGKGCVSCNPPSFYTLIVVLGVLVLKEILYKIMSRRAAEIKSTALLAEGLHHRSDMLVSVIVALGITASLIGGPAFHVADHWSALAACLVIFYNANAILKRAINDVMDERVSKGMIEEMLSLACSIEGVQNSEKCRVRKSGLTYLADIHIRVLGEMTVVEGHAISHQVKDLLMEHYWNLKDITVHLEPALPSIKT